MASVATATGQIANAAAALSRQAGKMKAQFQGDLEFSDDSSSMSAENLAQLFTNEGRSMIAEQIRRLTGSHVFIKDTKDKDDGRNKRPADEVFALEPDPPCTSLKWKEKEEENRLPDCQQSEKRSRKPVREDTEEKEGKPRTEEAPAEGGKSLTSRSRVAGEPGNEQRRHTSLSRQ